MDGTKGRRKNIKVGIIGAMEVEVAHLRDRMSGDARASKTHHVTHVACDAAPLEATDREVVSESCKGNTRHEEGLETTMHAGMTFYSGTIATTPAVLCMCKVGKVNAAACAQAMCDLFNVTHIINTGVAGSLDARIDIGDFVVSTDAVQHDMDVRNFGYEPGQVPGLDTAAFEADGVLRKTTLAAVAEAAPGAKALEGRVLSGDQFVRDREVKDRIKKQFGGLCCEMEGAAIAQVAHLNNVPFVIVRAISDKADGSDSQLYEEFEQKAAQNCARIVEHVLSSFVN